MGCVAGAQIHNNYDCRSNADESRWIDTPVGKLIVDVKSIFLQKVVNRDYKKSDILIKFRVSNQEEKLSLLQFYAKSEKERKIAFCINSCYKFHGRFMTIQIWSLNGERKFQAGLGIVDLKEIIRETSSFENFSEKLSKCYINYASQPAGFIELQMKFIKHRYQNLTFRVNSAFLQNETSPKSKFAAKITIGQQTLQTKKIEANDRNQLLWKDEMLSFRVPDFLEMGKIEVVEKKGSSDLFRGEYKLDLKFFLSERNQLQIDQELFHEDIIEGKIRISSIKGTKNALRFRELDSPKRKGRKITSIRLMEEVTCTEHQNCDIRECTVDAQEEDILPVIEPTRRIVSLPPLQVNDALKKLQERRRRKVVKDS